jgi:hypothetical protein
MESSSLAGAEQAVSAARRVSRSTALCFRIRRIRCWGEG